MVASCPSQEPPYSPRLAQCSPSRGRHSLQQGLPCLLWTAWWSASWHCVATASSPLVSASKLGAKQDMMGAAAVLPPGTPSQLGAEHGEVGGGTGNSQIPASQRRMQGLALPRRAGGLGDPHSPTTLRIPWRSRDSQSSPLPCTPWSSLGEPGILEVLTPLHPPGSPCLPPPRGSERYPLPRSPQRPHSPMPGVSPPHSPMPGPLSPHLRPQRF